MSFFPEENIHLPDGQSFEVVAEAAPLPTPPARIQVTGHGTFHVRALNAWYFHDEIEGAVFATGYWNDSDQERDIIIPARVLGVIELDYSADVYKAVLGD